MRAALAGVIAAFATVLAACGSSAPTDGRTTLHVELDLAPVVTQPGNHECRGQGDLTDVARGAKVVVRGDSGKVLARTTLGPGTQASTPETVPIPSSEGGPLGLTSCGFTIVVGVPKAKSYEVVVGNHDAGNVAYEDTLVGGKASLRLDAKFRSSP